MTSNQRISVATFGINGHEWRLLQTICQVSKNRRRIYELLGANAPAATDIAIVDSEDPQAMAAWLRFQASYPMVPAVMVTRRPTAGGADLQVGRPIMASRLLKLLDRISVVSESPAFAPPKFEKPTKAAQGVPAQVERKPIVSTSGPRLSALVVDDSLPIRKQIEYELAPFVGRVDLAENGERAMGFVTARSYDIIFLDVVLPGVDGYKICRAIKKDTRTRGTPVIMLTGKSSPFDRVKGKLAGCDTYLTKPVDHVTFEKVVKEYLNRREHDRSGDGGMADRRVLLPV